MWNTLLHANTKRTRPIVQRCVLSVLRCTLVVAAEAAVAVAAVMVVATVVVLLVVEESHGTILGLKIARFCHLLKRRSGPMDGRTYGRMDGWTDPLIEMRRI